MTFSNAVDSYESKKISRTENGMKAFAQTDSKVLDFFGKVGSARGLDMTKEFYGALAENEDLAIRALLWTRDIRSGSGERKLFRDLLVALEKLNPTLAGRLLPKIPFLGRWDDVLSYQEPINRKAAIEFIGEALRNRDGLCAKWMPRQGALAAEIRSVLGYSPKQWRKTLVSLTNVVETQMCSKEWNAINFSHVPSLASARYQKAFGRNASENYANYIRELQKPEAERDPKVKINAGAVYPYDVLQSVTKGNSAVADEQWKALPNYVGNSKIMPIVDVSGSMGTMGYNYGNTPSPINVAVSLGLYLAEKNTSDFKDMFITFNEKPEMVKLKGTLSQRANQMNSSNWGMNTNLHSAFNLLLDIALKGNVSQDDMPDTILILSDMQFDRCVKFDDRAIEMIARKYNEAGYTVPKVVFWNLNAGYGRDNTPVKFNERNVALVSGFSPAIMKTVLSNDLEEFSPFNVMVKALKDERYDY